jgi:hypothetical protein
VFRNCERSSSCCSDATRVFFRGDPGALEDPVNRRTADLETRRFLKQTGVFGEGGIRLGFQLLEQLVFVCWPDAPGTTRRGTDAAQRAELMFDQVQLDGLKMNVKLSRHLSARGARQDSLDDALSQIQAVSSAPNPSVHAFIMQNALGPMDTLNPFSTDRGAYCTDRDWVELHLDVPVSDILCCAAVTDEMESGEYLINCSPTGTVEISTARVRRGENMRPAEYRPSPVEVEMVRTPGTLRQPFSLPEWEAKPLTPPWCGWPGV